jgi:enoyl-CoA hydratase/carnithine racemase
LFAPLPHFSFGGEVREWPGKDINWFRTFVAEVNHSYRAIEALRVPTVAAVQGVAFGGGFELALNCDFVVAAENAVFRCVEVTTGMLPIAGALQRLAERVGRARASRFAMLGESIPGASAGKFGIATEVVAEAGLARLAEALAHKLAVGPTVVRGYADAAEGLVGGRRVHGRRHGAGHYYGSLRHRRFHQRLLEHGESV